MFNPQVELRATGDWFHCQVLNISWLYFCGVISYGVISLVYSADHDKIWSIRFLP